MPILQRHYPHHRQLSWPVSHFPSPRLRTDFGSSGMLDMAIATNSITTSILSIRLRPFVDTFMVDVGLTNGAIVPSITCQRLRSREACWDLSRAATGSRAEHAQRTNSGRGARSEAKSGPFAAQHLGRWPQRCASPSARGLPALEGPPPPYVADTEVGA